MSTSNIQNNKQATKFSKEQEETLEVLMKKFLKVKKPASSFPEEMIQIHDFLKSNDGPSSDFMTAFSKVMLSNLDSVGGSFSQCLNAGFEGVEGKGKANEDEIRTLLEFQICSSASDNREPAVSKNNQSKSASTANKATQTFTETDNNNSRHKRVRKPNSFLEAALFFSNITQSTVEVALELEPENFFAPPFLYKRTLRESMEWMANMRKNKIGAGISIKTLSSQLTTSPQSHRNKVLQSKTCGLFAVGLMQQPQHTRSALESVERLPLLTLQSNYFKRAIGLYAISLVDHLPANQIIPTSQKGNLANAKKSSSTSNKNILHTTTNKLLLNKNVELSDLQVPTPETLAQFWYGLDNEGKMAVLKSEASAVYTSGRMNGKKAACQCKYCRNISFKVEDIFDQFYRFYYQDICDALTKIENENTGQVTPPTTTNKSNDDKAKKEENTNETAKKEDAMMARREKSKRIFFKNISILSTEISSNRGPQITDYLYRLGRALEDPSASFNSHEDQGKEKYFASCLENVSDSEENVDGTKVAAAVAAECSCSECEDCQSAYFDEESNGDCGCEHCQLQKSLCSEDIEDDFYSEEENEEEEDEYYYRDFNRIEDEEKFTIESELALDEAHLPSSFPALYCQPDEHSYRNNSTFDPASKSNTLPANIDAISEGQFLYQSLASLLFQFSLIPHHLRAMTLEHQRQLLAEEECEAAERLAKLEAKTEAKRRKKERQRALKLEKQREQELEEAEKEKRLQLERELQRVQEHEKQAEQEREQRKENLTSHKPDELLEKDFVGKTKENNQGLDISNNISKSGRVNLKKTGTINGKENSPPDQNDSTILPSILNSINSILQEESPLKSAPASHNTLPLGEGRSKSSWFDDVIGAGGAMGASIWSPFATRTIDDDQISDTQIMSKSRNSSVKSGFSFLEERPDSIFTVDYSNDSPAIIGSVHGDEEDLPPGF